MERNIIHAMQMSGSHLYGMGVTERERLGGVEERHKETQCVAMQFLLSVGEGEIEC